MAKGQDVLCNVPGNVMYKMLALQGGSGWMTVQWTRLTHELHGNVDRYARPIDGTRPWMPRVPRRNKYRMSEC